MRELKIEKKELTEADKLLLEKSVQGARGRYKKIPEAHVERLEYELNVIINMGYSDYFLIVQDFLDFGRRVGHMPDERMDYLREHIEEMSIPEMNEYINADQSYPGLTIGPGRGSAAGSLVAYVLGITNLDPIEHGLLFERFLNPERVTMPDIDSDLSKAEFEYGVRDMTLAYVAKKYGKNAICGITVPSTLAVKAAIRNMARIAGSKKIVEKSVSKEEEDRVTKQYLKYGDRINALVPDDPKISFSTVMDENTGETLKDVLMKAFENEPEALDIIEIAERVCSLNINFGTHACGKIIYPGDIRKDYALMWDTKNELWRTQMDAEEAEADGLLKMDFLGLKNLNIATKAARLIHKNYGVYLDLERLPQDPEVYRNVFSTGRTLSIFQFESAGMKSMLRSFKPEQFSDIVLLVACYRPGPMQYLGDIIRRKRGEISGATNAAVTQIPQIREIVAPTYMAIVYQEQVQQVFRTLAGYSLGQADLVRRAMGHKEEEKLLAEREAFLYGDPDRNIPGCQANGVDVDLAGKLFDEMTDFAKYAFNKSHAAVYALIAYITAYLKFHYPTEFYISALEFSDTKKYQALIAEAKMFGVHVHGPNAERSQDRFSGINQEIYFGFSSIKGAGDALKGVSLSCKSFPDFILQTSLTESSVRTLIESGAFDQKVKNRSALLAVLPDYFEQKAIIKKALAQMELQNAMITDLANGIPLDRAKYKITTKSLPTKDKLEKKNETCREKIREAEQAIRDIVIPCTQVISNLSEDLEREKELLGIYASAHPLDPYGTPEDHGCTPLSDLGESLSRYDEDWVLGKISGLRMTTTKKTQEDMCFFTLEDQTDSIDVCCFAKSYQLCSGLIHDGAVVKCRGRKTKKRGQDDAYQFVLGSNNQPVEQIRNMKGRIFLNIEGIEHWNEVQNLVIAYAVSSGYPFFVYDSSTGSLYSTDFCVSEGIVQNQNLSISVLDR